jgi:hypothetical protein
MGGNGIRSGDGRKVSSLRELSPAIEPARDLWPAIEARISAERGPASAPRAARAWALPPRWLAAAAMVASVAVGVWIGRSLLPGGPAPAREPLARVVPAAVTGPATSFDAAYVSDPRYQRDRTALLQTLQARLAALPAPARAKVTASLAAISQAKQDLEGALGKDPSNALLQELLVNTYQDEMRVLTDLHQAGDAGRGI